MTFRPIKAVALAAAVVLLLAAAGCSSGDSSSSTTTTDVTTTEATTSTTSQAAAEATARFDKEIQSQLAAVGCYKGNVDGIVGPATDAAILDFQKASGLVADGELGTTTETALNAAVAAKKTVCGNSSTTTTAKPATTTTFAPNDAPCTATAIRAGLGGDSADPAGNITSFVCSGGYAAGTIATGAKFIVVAKSGRWTVPSPSPCGAASAGLPPIILEDGC